jgi:hypothetical protein
MNQHRSFKISEYFGGDNYRVPYIRMRGKWLEKFGFHRGSEIAVQVEYGRLIIENVEAIKKVAEPGQLELRFEHVE